MTLRLDDKWVWDFWLVRDGDQHHVFYLQAPRSLGEPELRHRNASIGHAVSADLKRWTVLPDALHPGDAGAWDDIATWTGSIIEAHGRWQMLYTGISSADNGLVQRIGLATSDDLIHWHKHEANPVLEADPRWYETLDLSRWRDQSWRDPWMFRTGTDDFIHALITARSPDGPSDGAGVVAHARSLDLVSWEVLPPVTDPGDFAQVEVPQLVPVGGSYSILVSCLAEDHSRDRLARIGGNGQTGTFVFSSTEMLGGYRAASEPVAGTDGALGTLYAGKIVQVTPGEQAFMAFRADGSGEFVGELTDPLPAVFVENLGFVVQDCGAGLTADAAAPRELAPEIDSLIAWGAEISKRYDGLEIGELRPKLQAEHDMEMRRRGMVLEPVASVTDHLVPVEGGEVTVRVFLPDGGGPHPVFIHFHGGGWVYGSIDSVVNNAKCSHICRSAGCAVATVEYRLAPEHRFPTAAEDCYAATRFVVEHADELEIDAGRVAIGGESAGGNLAAVVALMARDRGGPQLALQLLEVPVTDLSDAAAAYPSAVRYASGYGLDQAEMDDFVQQYLGDGRDDSNPYASPLAAGDLAGLPPAQVMTAEYDVLRDSGETYARRLREAGVRVNLMRMQGHTHGSPVLWPSWYPAGAWMESLVDALVHSLHGQREKVL